MSQLAAGLGLAMFNLLKTIKVICDFKVNFELNLNRSYGLREL
jgi:hypothetical protein